MAFEFPDRSDRPAQRVDMFVALAARIPSRDAHVANALGKLVGAYKDFAELQERLGRDESSTKGAKIVRLAKTARSKIAPLMDELEAAMAEVGKRQDYIRAELSKIYNPPNKTIETVMRHQEIRAMVRSMPRGEAIKFLAAASQANDEDTLVALVANQHQLSGLPPELHQNARDQLIAAHAPQQAEAMGALSEQIQHSTMFRDEMAASVAALTDFRRADEIMAAAREDAAAT